MSEDKELASQSQPSPTPKSAGHEDGDMVERVAEAMAEGDDWRFSHKRAIWRRRARAAIEAMREPSRHMAEMGSFKLCSPDLTTMAAIREAEDAYRAMIDAALKETP